MAKYDRYLQLTVTLPDATYPVYLGRGLLQDADFLQEWVSANQAMVVTNETVAALYLPFVQQALGRLTCDTVIIPDGEQFKNQHSLFTIYDALINYRHHRDTTLIALGGGVVGDITGFAASTYHRGVRLIHIPTTLLAQVDAAIGGKTAFNHPLGKNLIGSFYQPDAVLMDLDTLTTLPEREFRAGLGEVIKYALLEGGELLENVTAALHNGLTASSAELTHLIARCCAIKIRYVQEDERDMGQRVLLNLGHTFAHALEGYTGYQVWLHGEAVAIGLYCAAWLSYQCGVLDKAYVDLVDSLLGKAQLPRRIPTHINNDTLCDFMKQDKKIQQEKLRFVLMRAPGQCYQDDSVTESSLHATLNAVKGDDDE